MLLGGAPSAVFLIAGKGATLALAEAVLLIDALMENTGEPETAFASYEVRPRPWAEAPQRMARRNVCLSTSGIESNRSRARPCCAWRRGR